MEKIAQINDVVNSFAWGSFGVFLLIGSGIICTVITGFFQISHIRHWWKRTFGIISGEGRIINDAGSVSQFRAFCLALCATIGTGNIAGVSTAICVGGPGAVFWMWVAAFFGMMIKYAENVLGIYFRRRNSEGAWSGGPMYYLADGLAEGPGSGKHGKRIGKFLAYLFCIFTVLASFGVGNVAQVNKITLNVESAFLKDIKTGNVFGVSGANLGIGLTLMFLGAIIIMGGVRRLAAVSEKLVPFMTILYIAGCLVVLLMHVEQLPAAFASIFRFAPGSKALVGGATGTAVQAAMNTIKSGCKRGVFSNEAGLGSSVMAHINSCVREPVSQGLWGIAEVFFDTFVVCTMTAVVVLSSGFIDLSKGTVKTGIDDATLVARAFRESLGRPGEWFVVLSITLFAFTTVMGWSYYGAKVVEYLSGVTWAKIYRSFFVVLMVIGAVMESSLAWDISDTFNGLMMIPNLVGILSLTPLIVKLTKNYIDRRLKGMKMTPMLSYHPDIQSEAEKAVEKGVS